MSRSVSVPWFVSEDRLKVPEQANVPSEPIVLAMLPDDPARPLDLTILTRCAAIDSRFEMSLPPGHYVLNISRFEGQLQRGGECPEQGASSDG